MDGWTSGFVCFLFVFYFLLILLLLMWPSLLDVVFVALAVMLVVENPQSMQFPTLDHGRISD